MAARYLRRLVKMISHKLKPNGMKSDDNKIEFRVLESTNSWVLIRQAVRYKLG